MARALKVNFIGPTGQPETDVISGAGSFDQENGVLMVYTDAAGAQLYKMYAEGLWATAQWVDNP